MDKPKNIRATLGVNQQFTTKDREENDYYKTNPVALEKLLQYETFNNVWECAVGDGSLANVVNATRGSDIVDRGYKNTEILDFLTCNEKWNGDIVTNPPFKIAQPFVEKALELATGKVAILLRIQFLESKARRVLFDKYPPKYVYVFSARSENGRCWFAKNGENFERSNAMCLAWFVWYIGDETETIVRWL